MIACLPMYDWPELVMAHDALWQDIGNRLRASGLDAPLALSREGGDESHWRDPDLLLGQTCGYPLSTLLRDQVHYVATPVYDVKGCRGPSYSSAIVVRADSQIMLENWHEGRLAFNSIMSLSGYRAIKAIVGDPENFFASVVESSGHRLSARMVAKGDADIAALDAVCWHLLQKHEPVTADALHVIGWTELRPSLPLITSLNTSPDSVAKLREVLSQVLPPKALAIAGFEVLDIADYNKLSFL